MNSKILLEMLDKVLADAAKRLNIGPEDNITDRVQRELVDPGCQDNDNIVGKGVNNVKKANLKEDAVDQKYENKEQQYLKKLVKNESEPEPTPDELVKLMKLMRSEVKRNQVLVYKDFVKKYQNKHKCSYKRAQKLAKEPYRKYKQLKKGKGMDVKDIEKRIYEVLQGRIKEGVGCCSDCDEGKACAGEGKKAPKKAPKKSKKGEQTNSKWVAHVKEYQKNNPGKSWIECTKAAKATYVKKGKPVKKGKGCPKDAEHNPKVGLEPQEATEGDLVKLKNLEKKEAVKSDNRAKVMAGGKAKKPPSAWIKHVKDYQKEHKCSYKVALKQAAKTYKK